MFKYSVQLRLFTYYEWPNSFRTQMLCTSNSTKLRIIRDIAKSFHCKRLKFDTKAQHISQQFDM